MKLREVVSTYNEQRNHRRTEGQKERRDEMNDKKKMYLRGTHGRKVK